MPYQLSGELCSHFHCDLLVDNLSKLSIHTASDLFTADFAKLNALGHGEDVPFEKLIQLRSVLQDRLLGQSIRLCGIPPKTAVQCGSSRLNAIFNQMPSLSTIEISGPSGSGKSQLVFSMALESALNGKQVFFIDCDLFFRKQRLSAMAKSKCDYFSTEKFNDALSLIDVHNIFQFEKLIDFFGYISRIENSKNSLLIIDSLSYILLASSDMCYTTDINQLHQQRQANICQFWEAIKCTAGHTDSTVVFTRLSTKELKYNWDTLLPADISLELEEENAERVKVNVTNRSCELLKNPISVDVTIEINDSGVM